MMPDLLDRLRPALAGRYRIERELGRGGMATVYLAEDLKLGRPVAIKVLRPDLSVLEYEPERFLREIRIAATLSHPHILPLLDSGTIDYGPGLAGPYYVSPVMGCETLRDRLREESRLPIAEALRIAAAVASALDYAHRRGVLHRDVKPENILLQDGHPVVADFGVARAMTAAAADPVSTPGLAVGTPAYMSPEQASAEPELDGRSDLYALACVLYEMLAGQPPFAGTGPRATMARQVVEPVPPLRALRPEVSAGLEAVVRRALAKDPAERYPSAAAFAEALAQAPLVDDGAGPAAPPVAPRCIAVLPFDNAGPDPSDEFLSDGLTDELINALAQVDGLSVASRTTVFATKGRHEDVRALGARLGVAVVLEGSVRRMGERLRLTAQLTDVRDGTLLWSERYDRELRDVFALQEELARTIVQTLRGALGGGRREPLDDPVPRRYTENAAAYTLYLKGRFFQRQGTQAGIVEGIRCFERALEADPGYALAHTGLSDSYALQLDYRATPVADGMRRAREEAERALALDDSLAEAHTSLGWVAFIHDWDWALAEREFDRARTLNPRYATAHQWAAWYLVARGRVEEALASARRAVELDPASVSVRRGLGWLLYYARRPDQAAEQLRRALLLNPTAEESWRVLGLVELDRGRPAEAEAALREAIATGEDPSHAVAALGFVAGREGRRDEARARLAELEARAREQYVSPVPFVVAQLGVGDRAGALGWLERAWAERRGWLVYLAVEPLLDELRGEPRFAALVQRMRLAPPPAPPPVRSPAPA